MFFNNIYFKKSFIATIQIEIKLSFVSTYKSNYFNMCCNNVLTLETIKLVNIIKLIKKIICFLDV